MTQAELDKILNTYEWITVRKVIVKDMSNTETVRQYVEDLERHHKDETEFLIAKVREIAKEIYDLKQDQFTRQSELDES